MPDEIRFPWLFAFCSLRGSSILREIAEAKHDGMDHRVVRRREGRWVLIDEMPEADRLELAPHLPPAYILRKLGLA